MANSQKLMANRQKPAWIRDEWDTEERKDGQCKNEERRGVPSPFCYEMTMSEKYKVYIRPQIFIIS